MHIKVTSSSDAANLSNLLKDGDWMVLYYADWCGHCNTMKPEWQKVVNKMNIRNNSRSNSMNKINLAEIESTHIGDLINKPQVDGFPTIKMYNNGSEVAKFEDERIADKMEKFALSNSRQSSMTRQAAPKNIKIHLQRKLPRLSIPVPPKGLFTEHHNMKTPVKSHRSHKSHRSRKSYTKKTKPSPIPIQHIPIPRKPSPIARKPRPIAKKPSPIARTPSPIPRKPSHIPRKPSPIPRKTRSRKSNPNKIKKTKQYKPNVQKNNMRTSTRDVFGKLIKSFKRIGKEAEQDASLLTDARHLL